MRHPNARAVLFDLDGTLIDSIELIVRSYQHTLREHGKPAIEDGHWIRGMGIPLRTLLADFASDTAELDALVRTYRDWNETRHDDWVKAYPGAVQAVHDLARRGTRLGLVTGKRRGLAFRGVEVTGFPDVFEVVVGAEDTKCHKPDPEPILHALEQLGVAATEATYVGDSPHDLVAGRAAGVRTAAASWGPFSHEELRAVAPDIWLDDPVDVTRL
jgi:pyrophosphatase PpaX